MARAVMGPELAEGVGGSGTGEGGLWAWAEVGLAVGRGFFFFYFSFLSLIPFFLYVNIYKRLSTCKNEMLGETTCVKCY
jgi:hypothetical protein